MTCTACKDGFFSLTSTDNKQSCNACTSPCKTCKTSATTCLSCVANFVLTENLCKPNTCNTNTATPYQYANSTCTSCNGTNEYIVDGGLCKYGPLAAVSTPVLTDFKVSVTFDCKEPSTAILIYSLSTSANEVNWKRAQELFSAIAEKTENRTKQEKANWMQVDSIVITAADGKGTLQLTKVKNSGEVFNLKLFCNANKAWGWALTSFTSKDAGLKSLVLTLPVSRNLTKKEKIIAAGTIKKNLNIKTCIYKNVINEIIM